MSVASCCVLLVRCSMFIVWCLLFVVLLVVYCSSRVVGRLLCGVFCLGCDVRWSLVVVRCLSLLAAVCYLLWIGVSC